MDQSHLDKKYFLNRATYNCPFCNRRSVTYALARWGHFNWSQEKVAYYYVVQCGGCSKDSFHLSWFDITPGGSGTQFYRTYPKDGKTVELDEEKIDELFFYHQPTSHFTIDSRIPSSIRDMVSEADGCAKMNFMVGASGALRKAIYELLKDQAVNGENYEERIKTLKTQHASVPAEYFDALSNIQGMTSEELHEQEGSWEPWDKIEFDFLAGAVKAALREVYVVPEERKAALAEVLEIKKRTKKI